MFRYQTRLTRTLFAALILAAVIASPATLANPAASHGDGTRREHGSR